MPLPPDYNPVYHRHMRLFDVSLHANPWIQTPPIPHVEGLHTVDWLMSDPKKLSSTVLGDCLRFAFKDYDSGKLIPHLPLPITVGPFLVETLLGSKYQILFHQPNVLLEGNAVGVFQWVIAPPWFCIELRLPVPRFLAQAGAGAAMRRLAKAKEKLGAAQKAEAAWAKARSLREGMQAVQDLEAARRGRSDALKEAAAVWDAKQSRQDHMESDERQRQWSENARSMREQKRQYDRLSRQGAQRALQHDTDATAAFERAQRTEQPEQAWELAEAKEHRRQAASARQGAKVWAAQAEEREAAARAQEREAREERAAWRTVEEKKAKDRGALKKENPRRQATGESNAGMIAPSPLAHLPFPATVEIRVSWSQIGKVWVSALVSAAAEALKYYVGFIVDGILAPGKGKGATVLLDLVKSGINETLIDGGAKFLTKGTWPFKLSLKQGIVKVSAECEPDPATGTRKWHAKLALNEKGGLMPGLNPTFSVEGHGLAPPEKASGMLTENGPFNFQPAVDYASGVPAVN